MKHKLLAALLVLAILLTLPGPARAQGHGITDIAGHWGEEDILWAMEQGLFTGTSDTTFTPNGSMTRGMFVTVLGRYADVAPEDYQDWYLPHLFKDLRSTMYYAPYVNWAARNGITNGNGVGIFCPEDAITREQMAVFMVRFADTFGLCFQTIPEEEWVDFADAGAISGYARQAVEVMRTSGVLRGTRNGEGTYDFCPKALATRAECAAVFRRLTDALVPREDYEPVVTESVLVSEHERHGAAGQTLKLLCTMAPENTSNRTVLWVSSDPEVASVDTTGTVTLNRGGEATVYAYSANGFYDACSITVEQYIGYEGESYESKCRNVFGKLVADPRKPYGSSAGREEYEKHIVNVTVQVWDFQKGAGSEKVTKTRTIGVHKNLAATVEALFAELYACEAQYPVNSLGGYRWSNKSEHTPGLAIDINPNQNPYIGPGGEVLVGKKFDPENDPYSFEVGGEVERIFNKYGFTRGIYWNNGYLDYMHFSFFGR